MGTSLQDAKWATELTFDTATGTGSFLPFSAALTSNPAIIIFDNQSNVSVVISDDGVNPGKTFTAGEGLVLDLRANAPYIKELTWRIGTQFFANSAAGVGAFKISIVYAQ